MGQNITIFFSLYILFFKLGHRHSQRNHYFGEDGCSSLHIARWGFTINDRFMACRTQTASHEYHEQSQCSSKHIRGCRKNNFPHNFVICCIHFYYSFLITLWTMGLFSSTKYISIHVLGNFPHSQHRPSLINISLTLPVIHSVNKKRWNFRKADWDSFIQKTENSITLIPSRQISKEEAYTRFTGALSSAVHATIPRGVRRLYKPCMDEEAAALLQQYEESDNLIKSLNAARRSRWKEQTSELNFTHSSRKSWALIRRLGAAQRPVHPSRPSVSAKNVARHPIQLAKTLKNKEHDKMVRDGWRQFLRNQSGNATPPVFTAEDVANALKTVKPGTAPGYDNMHSEFLKHLGPKGFTWMAKLFTRIARERRMPKVWRRANVKALPKPGKDPQIPSSYRPVSLLSVCFKLLKRVVLQKISCQADEILSGDQAGFRRGRSRPTCDQVRI